MPITQPESTPLPHPKSAAKSLALLCLPVLLLTACGPETDLPTTEASEELGVVTGRTEMPPADDECVEAPPYETTTTSSRSVHDKFCLAYWYDYEGNRMEVVLEYFKECQSTSTWLMVEVCMEGGGEVLMRHLISQTPETCLPSYSVPDPRYNILYCW